MPIEDLIAKLTELQKDHPGLMVLVGPSNVESPIKGVRLATICEELAADIPALNGKAGGDFVWFELDY